MKFLHVPLTFLLLALAVCSARAGDDERVTAQVRGFYQWYLPLLESGKADGLVKHQRKEMARYLTAKLLAKLAKIPADTQEGDYFVESLDADPEWAKNIAIRNVKIDAKGRATAEVRLSGGTAAKVNVKVTLVREGGAYKIDDVDGNPDYSEMAAAQIRAFYAQYLHFRAYAAADAPLERETVQDGITADCLKKATASASGAQKVDYFLQSTDLDPAWEEHVEVKPTEIVPDGTHGTVEVLLTGEKIPKAHLKVSLKNEKDTFKIDGVEKIND